MSESERSGIYWETQTRKSSYSEQCVSRQKLNLRKRTEDEDPAMDNLAPFTYNRRQGSCHGQPCTIYAQPKTRTLPRITLHQCTDWIVRSRKILCFPYCWNQRNSDKWENIKLYLRGNINFNLFKTTTFWTIKRVETKLLGVLFAKNSPL